MRFEHLRFFNFRCYEQAELEPDPSFNVVKGLNGQGKTSVLEAIGLLCFLRSFRAARNAEMLRLGTTEGKVTGQLTHDDLSFTLAVKLLGNRKQATFNGKVCRFLSEYVCRVSAVSFSPNDLEIVRGSPEHRRVWIDKLAQIRDPSHADAVSRYHKLLEQRNRQLRSIADGSINRLPDDFEVWTEELITWGARIIHSRLHNVDKSVEKIAQYYAEISHQKSDINVEYQSDILPPVPYGQENPSSLEIIDQVLRKALESSLKKEMILGTTIVGPHRDDLSIRMDNNPVKAFGSQGEVRSLVLALRLAEVDAYHAEQNVNPILLIDDFSSELDARRRKYLLDYLVSSGSQVFLSTTEELDLGKVFLVNEGRISPHGHGHPVPS